MCPSSWKLYVDDFPFFSSSLACLEPELELFEVWEINVRQIIIIANGINSQTPKLQRALTWVLDQLANSIWDKCGFIQDEEMIYDTDSAIF